MISPENLGKLALAITEASVPLSPVVSIRKGQQVFNAVYLHLPEVANKLRASSADPFYKNDRIPLFWMSVIRILEEEVLGN